MNKAEISGNLHILIGFKERLAELQRDFDREFQPAALKLYDLNILGGEELCGQMQAFGSHLESLPAIVSGVTLRRAGRGRVPVLGVRAHAGQERGGSYRGDARDLLRPGA